MLNSELSEAASVEGPVLGRPERAPGKFLGALLPSKQHERKPEGIDVR